MLSSNRNRVLLVSSGVFFAIGLLALIGTALPDLAHNNNSSLASMGAIFTALYLGSIPAQLVSGWLNDKYGPRPLLGWGLVVLAVGLLGVTLSHDLLWTLVITALAGVGDGALVVGANVIVAQTFSKRRASALSLMNVFYGIGAVIGPILVGVSLGAWQSSLPALWVLCAILVLLAVVSRTLQKGPILSAEKEQHEQANEAAGPMGLYKSPLLWLTAVLLLLYVGIELGIGGWIATYTRRTTLITLESAAFVASAFYLALTGGRLVGAALGTRLKSEQILMLCFSSTVVGGAGMLLSVGNLTLTIVSVVLTGIALGPVYPTLLALTAERFSSNAGKASALVMSVGSIGGMVVPPVLGILLEGLGAASVAQFLAILIVVMLALFSLTGIVTRRMDRVEVAMGERAA